MGLLILGLGAFLPGVYIVQGCVPGGGGGQ